MSERIGTELLSRVTSKGQTTIPKQLRDALGITDGTPLRWTLDDGVLKVRAKTKRLEDFLPMLPPDGGHLTTDQMDEVIGAAAVERFRRKATR